MAEETTAPETTEEQETTEGGLPTWLKIVIIGLVLAILVVAAYYVTRTYLLPRYEEYRIAKALEEEEAQLTQVKPMGVVYALEGFTVNTLGSAGRRFIVADYVVEAPGEEVVEEIKIREPQIRNEFINYLRKQTSNQVLDLDFQEKSQGELMEILNKHLNSGQVDSLYYTRLILQ